MAEQERIDGLSLQVFADRFQTEKLGLVYCSNGLGRGGCIVTHDEADKYITDYAVLLSRNKGWLAVSAKVMIAGLFIGAVVAYLWFALVAVIILIVAVALFFSIWANAMFGPSLFEMRVSRDLNRRIASMPLSRAERIERGFAWPYWKNMFYYFVGAPLLVFLMLHRAGPNGLVSLLGFELAHQYDIAIKLFVVGICLFAFSMLPVMLWKKRKRARNQISAK